MLFNATCPSGQVALSGAYTAPPRSGRPKSGRARVAAATALGRCSYRLTTPPNFSIS